MAGKSSDGEQAGRFANAKIFTLKATMTQQPGRDHRDTAWWWPCSLSLVDFSHSLSSKPIAISTIIEAQLRRGHGLRKSVRALS